MEPIKVKAGSLHWHEALNGWYLYGTDAETGREVFCNAITTEEEDTQHDPNDDPELMEAYGIEEV